MTAIFATITLAFTLLAGAGVPYILRRHAVRLRSLTSAPRQTLLCYAPNLLTLGLLFVTLFPAVVNFVVIFYPPQDRGDWIAYAGFYLMTYLIGGPLILECWKVRMLLDDNGIESLSLWRKRRYLKWSEIQSVTFSMSLQWFRIGDVHGNSIRAHNYLINLDLLLQKLRSETPWGKANPSGEITLTL